MGIMGVIAGGASAAGAVAGRSSVTTARLPLKRRLSIDGSAPQPV
jgi:hypothetical protein